MFRLDGRQNVPIYEQVVRRVKELTLRGVLKPGDKLPTVRELSAMIVANPNTVSKAYQELERSGVIETRPGKGTFVAERIRVEPDERIKADLRERLWPVVVDAVYFGVRLKEFEAWVREAFNELGGESGEPKA
ncbi:MAG: GntR family transcriptional regulator [Hydrogenibacillus sp.]|nr:GntR family transcriptional regulator [Hydrogenibacillus sp.]